MLRSAHPWHGIPIAAELLADLFRLLEPHVRLVVLNACWSKLQADEIVKHIDFVVGMSGAISDEAARAFSTAFYRALVLGWSVQAAFDLAINELELRGLSEEARIPTLLVRMGRVAANTTLASLSLIAWVGVRLSKACVD